MSSDLTQETTFPLRKKRRRKIIIWLSATLGVILLAVGAGAWFLAAKQNELSDLQNEAFLICPRTLKQEPGTGFTPMGPSQLSVSLITGSSGWGRRTM